MDARLQALSRSGFEIVWSGGSLCRACRHGQDHILRWSGESWVVLQ